MPEPLRLFRVRTYAKHVDLAAYELCFRTFWTEVEKEVAAVRALMTVGAVA